MTEAFQHDGPALIDAVVNRTELSMPPPIKLDHAVGFNLWVIKAVLVKRVWAMHAGDEDPVVGHYLPANRLSTPLSFSRFQKTT